MKKLAIITCAVMLNILILPHLALNSGSDAELPEWEIGYTWNYKSTGSVPNTTANLTYKVIDVTNINVNGKDYEVYVVNITSVMDFDGSILKEYRNKYISKSDLSIIKINISSLGPLGESIVIESVFYPPMKEYDFPLYLEKTWNTSYNKSIRVVGENTFNISEMSNYNVVLEETITVPAGSFDCYKIEIDNGPWSINYMWYSSEVRNIVKHTGEADDIPFEVELNSYSFEAKEIDDEDSNPLTSSNYLLPIIIIIIIVVLIVSILVLKKRKKTKKKKKKGKSKSKSKKKKK